MERNTGIALGVGAVAVLALCVCSDLACVLSGGVAGRSTPAGGGGGLTGLWGHRDGLDWTWYAFSPDGLVHEGIPPGGIDHWDPRATPAAELGTYAVAGGRLIIRRGGRTTLDASFASSGGTLTIDGEEYARLDVGFEDARLEGTFECSDATSQPGLTFSSSRTLRFARDGTYETESAALFTGAPDAESGVHGASGASRSGVERGRWRIDGSTLSLTDAGGATRRYTLTMDPDTRRDPNLIRLDEAVYLRQR